MFAMIKFVFFNVGLNSMDVGTDFSLFLSLLVDDHFFWAALTMMWMLMPFFVNLVMFFIDTYKKKDDVEKLDCMVFFKTVPIHLPFVLPIRKLWYTKRLFSYGFGRPSFDRARAKEVDEIQKKVSECATSESYWEAGPQAVTQLIIYLSTGLSSWTLIISVAISLLSLSLGASRTFFIMRPIEVADPDPEFKMVCLRIMPYMLLVTVNSIAFWVMIGGLLGGWTFVAIPLNIAFIYAVLRCVCSETRPESWYCPTC
jgi:hypothetical protein